MRRLSFLTTVIFLLCACAPVVQVSPTTFVPTLTPDVIATQGQPQPIVATQPLSFDVSWRTYQNDELGISFEYPAVYDEPQYESCAVRVNSFPDGTEISMGHQSFLLIQGSEEGVAIQSYVENLVAQKGWMLETQEESTVGGEEAIHIEYRFGGGRFGTATITSHDGLVYAFNFYAGAFCDAPEANLGEGYAYQHWLESFAFAP